MPAAVPQRVGDTFDAAPPGHRFRLYFEGWWTRELEKHRMDVLERDLNNERHPNKCRRIERDLDKCRDRLTNAEHLGGLDDKEKREALDRIVDKRAEVADGLSTALRDRQRRLADALPGAVTVRRSARTTAPVMIGTGVEHPMENGLLFYDPHGVPYIPGSTVKGVLRRAAEELALFESDSAWTLGLVWCLFGFDANSACFADAEEAKPWRLAYRTRLEAHGFGTYQWLRTLPGVKGRLEQRRAGRDLATFLRGLADLERPERERKLDLDAPRHRGAVECWDAFFVPPRMRVDIMNPHLGGYYQQSDTPHESGAPKPIYFLAVDAGVEVDFVLRLRTAPALAEAMETGLDESWKSLINAALDRAASILGFGAKTAVGYGRIDGAASVSPRPTEQRVGRRDAPIATAMETWECTVRFDPGRKTLDAVGPGAAKAHADQARTMKLLAECPPALRSRLEKKKEAKARVVVRVEGNQRTIETLEGKA